jgi:hypothetical protein
MRDGLPMLRVPVSHEGVVLPQRRHDWIERALAKIRRYRETTGRSVDAWTPECLDTGMFATAKRRRPIKD